MAANLSRLKRKRGQVRSHITKVVNDSDAIMLVGVPISQEDRNNLEYNREDLEKQLSVIHKLDDDINILLDDDEADADFIEADEYSNKLNRCIFRISKILAPTIHDSLMNDSNSNSRRTSDAVLDHSVVKLPQLQLPKFTGSYTEWYSFKDLFDGAIDSNPKLTNSQKLYYLKTSLQADALKLIATLKLTDENYDIAKSILTKRYENVRLAVRSHLQNLFDCPVMKADDIFGLRKINEIFDENLLGLNAKNVETDHWDPIIIHMMVNKLDSNTRKEWELSTPGNELQTLSELKSFINSRCQALEFSTENKSQNTRMATRAQVYHANISNCLCCGEQHKISTCNKFTGMGVPDRRKLIQEKKACFNCLAVGHSYRNCSSKFSCKTCNGKHHTMLHLSNPSQTTASSNFHQASDDIANNEDTQPSGFHGSFKPSDILLPTASISIRNRYGDKVTCRALLDSGSQLTLISDDCVKRLQLKKRKHASSIHTLDSSSTKSSGLVDIIIQSSEHGCFEASAMVLKRLANKLPTRTMDNFQDLNIDNIADPKFWIPGEIDVIIGSDLFEDIVLQGKKKGNNGCHLRETVFGWVVSGKSELFSTDKMNLQSFSIQYKDEFDLQRFWEVEEIPTLSNLSHEEEQCVKHFTDTTKRLNDGRFVVKMPFKDDIPDLGDSFLIAKRRFLGQERRLIQDNKLREKYNAFIQEFLDLDHLEKVPESQTECEAAKCFYLPHHAVFKEASTTTKLRVVFDDSAKTTSGVSLNDKLMIGPKIQDDIVTIMIRFRFHKVAMTGDVAKMYRQIQLSDADQDYHRLLWRWNPNDKIDIYRMKRVTYGIRSSSYHSIRALTETSTDTKNEDVSQRIRNDFYVDDLSTGADSVDEALIIQKEIIRTLETGQFQIRKWASSHSELIDHLDPSLRENSDLEIFKSEGYSLKTLGVKWKPNSDQFIFEYTPASSEYKTKRNMLSEMSRIFDPMGWISPVIIKLKCFMQELWVQGMNWDDVISNDILEKWNEMIQNLPLVSEIALNRHVSTSKNMKVLQIHVFCDASEKAYAAAIYIRVVDEENVTRTHLLISKTRVAPIKVLSLPRLELCAAYLGCKLLELVSKSLERFQLTYEVFGWSDSEIVLCWLSELPRKWTTFVANRVSFIQQIIPPDHWRHVPSKENPSDCASRGLLVNELIHFTLWWEGPIWLAKSEDEWPGKFQRIEDIPEIKKSSIQCTTVTVDDSFIDFSRFSSMSKLLNTYILVKKFINCLKQTDTITTKLQAEIEIIQRVQKVQFTNEIELLEKNKPLPQSSKILALAPFWDEETRLLKVGGRLSQSEHSENIKHPIILDSNHHLVKLLIKRAHDETLHGGPNLTLYKLREKIWITKGRAAVRKFVHHCIDCARFSSKSNIPIMANLPEERITSSRPFSFVGLDFAGPLTVKVAIKTKRTEKCYIAVFVCFSTKAVHLELVSSLDKHSCHMALLRFISRRGVPNTIFSDNATNFLACRKDIEVIYEQWLKKSNDLIDKITWSVIPPSAPHFGGLWESAVKSAKHHMKRILGNTIWKVEPLQTLLNQIEAILNSRPLTPQSSDPNDLRVITPGHFLIGSELLASPVSSDLIQELPFNKQFKELQERLKHFWARWSHEYLNTLQERLKWKSSKSVFKIGDLVLIIDKDLQPMQWKKARIIELYTGNDGISRVAKLKTSNNILIRPIVKLRLLPLDE